MNYNPLKELVESKEFKELPPYRQKQQFYKLRNKLGRRIKVKTIKAN